MGSARPASSFPPAPHQPNTHATGDNDDGNDHENIYDDDNVHDDDGGESGRSMNKSRGSSRKMVQQNSRTSNNHNNTSSNNTTTKKKKSDPSPSSLLAWRETWRKLRTATWSLACDCRRDVASAKLWGPVQASELREEQQQLAEATQRSDEEAASELSRVRAQVKALGPALPFAGSKERAVALVQAAERQLALLRERQRQEYRELCLEEANLTETLESQFFRFEAWLAPGPSKAIPPTVTTAKATKRDSSNPRTSAMASVAKEPSLGGPSSSSAPAAVALRDQIQELSEAIRSASHPSRSVLNEEDQDVVRRALRQWPKHHKIDEALVEDLQRLLPQHSFAELQESAEAMQRCRAWQEERRVLLAEWKAEQQESRRPPHRSSSSSTTCLHEQQHAFRPPSRAGKGGGGGDDALEDAELAEELRRREESWAKASKERERRRLEVLEWKKAKEAAKQNELSEEAAKREAERQRRAEEQRERREAQRSQLEAFRAARAASEAASKEALRRRSQSHVGPDVRARIASRNSALLERAAREKAVRAEKDRLGGLKSLLDDDDFHTKPSSTALNANAFSHVTSKVYEDAERKVADMRSHSVSEMEPGHRRSRLDDKMPGSWAHQAIVRTTRALPAWRHQYGA